MRMFIASHIRITPEIESLVKSLSSNKNLKVTALNNFHLTYLFLGDISSKESDRVADEIKKISGVKFTVKISGITAFPDINHPRVIVLVLKSEFLSEIYNSILRLLPEYENSNQKFLPHITIARARKSGVGLGILSPAVPDGALTIDNLCLIKSVLTREGPVYQSVYCKKFK
ncbi:MAG: RNA 2',3'-cyclic phosphodiesterase [Ferroplasma sp.]|uniref:RNA 2',3'-cyclic phosphodiesterase n=1 Tax=Ferroplasma sp. TaxID=2591003 RepID=UPI002815BC71|nr:RNA 2',3'-cyclic phosphodiesterase [Ferroplasma sp.]WMT50433.1 MAG: RNA 2',3'-cyclic phosphodiesterase [Ferroplasma sp.]